MAMRISASPSDSGAKLAESLERLSALGTETVKDMRLLLESFDPAKDAVQVSRQLNELAASLDWSQMPANVKNPEISTAPLHELSEIQSAAIKELGESHQRAFQSALSGSQTYLSALGNLSDYDAMIAAVIDANIDQFEDMKSNALRLVQVSARIKSAYMAWTEKTLRSLLAPH